MPGSSFAVAVGEGLGDGDTAADVVVRLADVVLASVPAEEDEPPEQALSARALAVTRAAPKLALHGITIGNYTANLRNP
jgi:hypothetical protein